MTTTNDKFSLIENLTKLIAALQTHLAAVPEVEPYFLVTPDNSTWVVDAPGTRSMPAGLVLRPIGSVLNGRQFIGSFAKEQAEAAARRWNAMLRPEQRITCTVMAASYTAAIQARIAGLQHIVTALSEAEGGAK